MEIRNRMEDMVVTLVGRAFDEEEEKSAREFCTCYQCRMDVACYVLNKIEPEYVISGRGIAHLAADYLGNVQKRTDVEVLIWEGIKTIQSGKRPHFTHSDEGKSPKPEGPYFNFPTIIGRLFNAGNFAPVSDIDVYLLQNNELLQMIDPSWQNPYRIVKNTPATFLFYPQPVSAAEQGQVYKTELELRVEDSAYNPFHHFFTMEIISEDGYLDVYQSQKAHTIEDLYLIPAV
jgi:competence protein ComFB